MAIEIDCVVPGRARLGEGAFWDHRAQRLWWVDIHGGLIHGFDPASGENQTWDWGEPVGCLAPREQGGLLLATESGFHFFDPVSGAREALVDPEAGIPGNRFNDGCTDPRGRFWAGTMKDGGEPERRGRFYRFDAERRVTPFFDRVHTTNGLAFSPDGKTLYFSDTNTAVQSIWSSDYDLDSGQPGEPRLFFDAREVAGRPDGGTVDADGCYWMAGVTGWQVVRITPTGKVDRIVEVPAERPSKPMFGGPNLDRLYVTTIGSGTTPGSEQRQPEAGGLFAISGLGVQGIEQARFAG